MYDTIRNPFTNRFVNVNSKIGKTIVNSYLYKLGGLKQIVDTESRNFDNKLEESLNFGLDNINYTKEKRFGIIISGENVDNKISLYELSKIIKKYRLGQLNTSPLESFDYYRKFINDVWNAIINLRKNYLENDGALIFCDILEPLNQYNVSLKENKCYMLKRMYMLTLNIKKKKDLFKLNDLQLSKLACLLSTPTPGNSIISIKCSINFFEIKIGLEPFFGLLNNHYILLEKVVYTISNNTDLLEKLIEKMKYYKDHKRNINISFYKKKLVDHKILSYSEYLDNISSNENIRDLVSLASSLNQNITLETDDKLTKLVLNEYFI